MKLEGQVAIVTGAGRGIGAAIAKTLAKEGAAVAVNDIDLERASKVAEEIKAQGEKALPIKADVSKRDEVNNLVKKTLASFQRVDILVNNAGIAKLTPSLDLDEEEWDSTIDTNLKGQFLCSQAVAKHMVEQKRGKIINITSLAAHTGTPGLLAYSASKGGVVQLTKVLAVEWGKHNITVNAVSPGFTITELVKTVFQERPDVFQGVERIPLGRPAMPEDIANTVLFLASPESDYVSGQLIAVDGGTLCVHPRMVKPTE